MPLNPASSQRPTVFAAPTSAPFGHGDKVGGGPNGLDGLPGRLAPPAQGPSCMTTGASPGPTGTTLLEKSVTGDFAALHGRAKV